MIDNKMDKKTCVDWLSQADGDFTNNIVELEGSF